MKTPKQLHNQTTELKTVLHLIFSFDQDYTKETNITQPNSTRIRHTVVFKLNHAKGSPEEHAFLTAAKELSSIAGVENFESLKQVSKKNKFEFDLSMEFANHDAYDHYNNHPEYVDFVQQRWLKEVDEFMKIDYVVI